MKTFARVYLVALSCALAPGLALADTTVNGSATVNASDNIYASGSQSALVTNCVSIGYCGAGGQGTLPGSISVSGTTYITFSASGTISLNGGGATNDPDGLSGGNPAYVTAATSAGFESLSGITAPGAGYLVGVFVSDSGPSGTAPASLNYIGVGAESQTSYDPLLDQVFFIGDGLTGDGTGTTQQFYVPTGATELYLGIADACNFSGSPSCYGDNQGAFNGVEYSVVTVGGNGGNPSPTPEPSSLALLGTTVLGAAGVLRRRIRLSR